MIRSGRLEYIIENLDNRARSARISAGLTASEAASDGRQDYPSVYYELRGKAKAYDDAAAILRDDFNEDEPQPRDRHFARHNFGLKGEETGKWEVVNWRTMRAIPETFKLEIDAYYVATELSPDYDYGTAP
jgi:hypothetical protein